MDIRQLKCLIAVYERGSLSGAAEQLNIAVSAVSHHINALEAELAAPLFDRAQRGMTPTAAGERLFDHARAIMHSIDDAVLDVRAQSRDLSGRLTISMSHTAMQMIGAPLAQKVLSEFPKVELRLLESLSGLTVEDLRTRDVDLALAYNPQSRTSVKMTPLLEEALGCIGAPEILNAKTQSITFDKALSLPIVLIGIGASSRILFERADVLRKATSASIMQTDSPMISLALARSGKACTIGPRSLIDSDDDTLCFQRIKNPSLKRTLFLCEDGDRPRSLLRDTIQSAIAALIAENIENGRWRATSLI